MLAASRCLGERSIEQVAAHRPPLPRFQHRPGPDNTLVCSISSFTKIRSDRSDFASTKISIPNKGNSSTTVRTIERLEKGLECYLKKKREAKDKERA